MADDVIIMFLLHVYFSGEVAKGRLICCLNLQNDVVTSLHQISAKIHIIFVNLDLFVK